MARKDTVSELDIKAWRILDALQGDGRAPLKALATSANLSIAATSERLKRLQECGVIRSVAAVIDPTRTGYPVKAIVGITANQPGKKALLDKLKKSPEVIECHHVAGADSYVMIVVTQGMDDLERFIGTINDYGETRTSIVFSTPIERRAVVRPGSVRGV